MEQLLALPCYTAFPLLAEANSTDEAERLLKKRGYKYINSGAFTRVYGSPCGTRVVKLTSNDEGAEATLRAAEANPDNPHFPRIYGRVDYGDWNEMAVETERLVGADTDGSYSRWSRDYGDNGHRTPPDLTDLPEGPMKDALAALIKERDECEDFLGWDAHSGNVMVRPDTGEIVLTDLLAYFGRKAVCAHCDDTICEDDGYCVGDALWCEDCYHEHAHRCGRCGEASAEPDGFVKLIGAWQMAWLANAPVQLREDLYCDACVGDADGYVHVEERAEFWEPELHGLVTAIAGIAQECLALHEQPRLPLPLAA